MFPIVDLNINARIEYVGFEVGLWECGCGEFKELGGPGVVCEKCGQEVTYNEIHEGTADRPTPRRRGSRRLQ